MNHRLFVIACLCQERGCTCHTFKLLQRLLRWKCLNQRFDVVELPSHWKHASLGFGVLQNKIMLCEMSLSKLMELNQNWRSKIEPGWLYTNTHERTGFAYTASVRHLTLCQEDIDIHTYTVRHCKTDVNTILVLFYLILKLKECCSEMSSGIINSKLIYYCLVFIFQAKQWSVMSRFDIVMICVNCDWIWLIELNEFRLYQGLEYHSPKESHTWQIIQKSEKEESSSPKF